MSDRTRHADEPRSFDDVIDTTTSQADDPAVTTRGHTLAVLASSNRIVLKSGRLSGGRACALSARVASRGILRRYPKS
jgi:hypothetical protein